MLPTKVQESRPAVCSQASLSRLLNLLANLHGRSQLQSTLVLITVNYISVNYISSQSIAVNYISHPSHCVPFISLHPRGIRAYGFDGDGTCSVALEATDAYAKVRLVALGATCCGSAEPPSIHEDLSGLGLTMNSTLPNKLD